MVSLKKQLAYRKGKIVWLTSYPKSGNTWLRCFLEALIYGTLNINQLKVANIFCSRALFDNIFDVDSRLLKEYEIKNQMPAMMRYHAQTAQKLLFFKIHDAFSYNQIGEPIVPADVSHKVIYLIRNPLDIVASYANHSSRTNDSIIRKMNQSDAYLSRQANGLNNLGHLPQCLLSWCEHVESWHQQKHLEVVTIRYEDMNDNPYSTFAKIVAAIGLETTTEQINRAIEYCEFENLKKIEKKEGFIERGNNNISFFRKGKVNSYQDELTPVQISSICRVHGLTMRKFGYEIPKEMIKF